MAKRFPTDFDLDTPTVDDVVFAHDATTNANKKFQVGDLAAVVAEKYDIRRSGAVGDGVTDDTAALIDAFSVAAGGRILAPPGEYLLDGATRPRIALSDTTLEGAGVGRTRFVSTDTDNNVELVIVGQGTGDEISNVVIDGIEFGFDAANTVRDGTACLRASRVHNLTIRNCKFEHGTYGIYVDRAHGFVIADNEVTGTRADGINCNNGSDTTAGMSIRNGRIYGNHVHDTQDDCIAVGGVYDGDVNRSEPQDILIWGNDLHDVTSNGGGIGVYGVNGCSVFGNKIRNPVSHFFNIVSETPGSTPQYANKNVQVFGNDCYSFDASPAGGSVSGPVCMWLVARDDSAAGTEPDAPWAENIRVYGNRFVVNDRSGIWCQLNATPGADLDLWPTNIVIEDNELTFIGTPPANDYRGLNFAYVNGLTVARNRITNFPHLGVNIANVRGLRYTGNAVSECVGNATYSEQNMANLAIVAGDTIHDISGNEFRKSSGTVARMAQIGNASSTTYSYAGNRYYTTGATISTAEVSFGSRPTVPVYIGEEGFDKGHAVLGSRRIWFDTSGIPRTKASAPSTTGDGAPLGHRPGTSTSANTNPISVDSDTTAVRVITALAASPNVNAPTGTPTEGQRLTLKIRDNGTPRTLTWNAAYVPINGVTLPTTTTAGKWHRVEAEWSAADSEWQVFSVGVEA